MKIRCVIDGLTLHDMTLSPFERLQLERTLQAQLASALRSGWTGTASAGAPPSPVHHLRIDLPHATAPLGQSLGQALGAALSSAAGAATGPWPAACAGAAPSPAAGARAALSPVAGDSTGLSHAGGAASAPGIARSR